jgi:hypothetical protein
MKSRNAREGLFVGQVFGKAVRRREWMAAIFVGSIELFPACPPYVDSCVAWTTMTRRTGLPLHTLRRYIAKGTA